MIAHLKDQLAALGQTIQNPDDRLKKVLKDLDGQDLDNPAQAKAFATALLQDKEFVKALDAALKEKDPSLKEQLAHALIPNIVRIQKDNPISGDDSSAVIDTIEKYIPGGEKAGKSKENSKLPPR